MKKKKTQKSHTYLTKVFYVGKLIIEKAVEIISVEMRNYGNDEEEAAAARRGGSSFFSLSHIYMYRRN